MPRPKVHNICSKMSNLICVGDRRGIRSRVMQALRKLTVNKTGRNCRRPKIGDTEVEEESVCVIRGQWQLKCSLCLEIQSVLVPEGLSRQWYKCSSKSSHLRFAGFFLLTSELCKPHCVQGQVQLYVQYGGALLEQSLNLLPELHWVCLHSLS